MADELKITSQSRGKAVLVKLNGPISGSTIKTLDEGLSGKISKHSGVILDMNDVESMTSQGLGILIKHTESLGDPDRLVLARLQPQVLETFRLMGLDEFFSIADSVEAAIEALEAGGGGI